MHYCYADKVAKPFSVYAQGNKKREKMHIEREMEMIYNDFGTPARNVAIPTTYKTSPIFSLLPRDVHFPLLQVFWNSVILYYMPTFRDI